MNKFPILASLYSRLHYCLKDFSTEMGLMHAFLMFLRITNFSYHFIVSCVLYSIVYFTARRNAMYAELATLISSLQLSPRSNYHEYHHACIINSWVLMLCISCFWSSQASELCIEMPFCSLILINFCYCN